MTWVCAWCGQTEAKVKQGVCAAIYKKCDTTKLKEKTKRDKG